MGIFDNVDLGKPKVRLALREGDTVEVWIDDICRTGNVELVDDATDDERLTVVVH